MVPAYPPPSMSADTSSWGGSVARDENGLYHMFVSEMSNHCGIDSWAANSTIVHATSRTPEGPYERKGVVMKEFAHNPTVTRAVGGGPYLIYHIGCGTGPSWGVSPCDQCSGGSSNGCARGNEQVACGSLPNSQATTTNIISSPSLSGPWTATDYPISKERGPKFFFGLDNPAPYMRPDGSVLMLGRAGGGSVGRITAPSWTGPYTLEAEIALGGHEVEDPFLYYDRSRKVYHALFHSGKQNGDYLNAGGHAFSKDGIKWHFSATPTYTTTVTTADGKSHLNWRRERPHLIIDETTGDPTHLITSLWPCGDNDKAMTFVQRINTTKN